MTKRLYRQARSHFCTSALSYSLAVVYPSFTQTEVSRSAMCDREVTGDRTFE
ncbi:hypothetical protein [Microcoleus sp. D3_18a_C4]|uniref:hypothetical protein n=1 Tax=Microcoleus sp. D3_18a_C4 TaxID=3055332 RepID=UPI002FCF1F9C